MPAGPSAVSLDRRWVLAVVWVAVGLLTWWLLVQWLVNVRDEVWMLWVATRVARGEVLYRDVYDVTTPVAAWLAGGVVSVTGPHLVVLRGLVAAAFATEVLLSSSVTRRTGLGSLARGVLILVLLAVATPALARVSLYSALSIALALATLRVTIWWCDTAAAGSGRRAAAAWTVGVVGAVAFWTKPNVGVLVAAAVAVVAVVTFVSGRGGPWRRWLGDVARTVAAAGVVSAVFVAIVLATGAWTAFVDQVFASKGEYLQTGFDYLPDLAERIGALARGETPLQVRRVVGVLVQGSPLVLLAAAVVGAFRARGAPLELRVAFVAFTVVGLIALLPRPGLNHMVGSMPLVLTCVVAVWALGNRRGAPARGARPVAPLVVAGLAVAVVVGVAVPLGSSGGAGARADLAHFERTPVSARQAAASARLRRDLQVRGVDEVFIVRRDSGFLHLRTGTTNPLPFDYVERSDFGGAGEPGVIRRLARGDAEWVCVRKPGSGGVANPGLMPHRLERWVRTNFAFTASVARCDLYRAVPIAGPRA